MDDILDSLSLIERTVVPYLHKSLNEIIEKSGLDKTSVLRALSFLENKKILILKSEQKNIVDIGVNGIHYKKNHLPERNLLFVIENNDRKTIQEIRAESKMSDNEFKVALGTLKNKALIELKEGKIWLIGKKEEISKRFPEELFLEKLPMNIDELDEYEKKVLKDLSSRRDILEIHQEKIITFELTEIGKKIAGKIVSTDLIEELTPEMIKNGIGNKKFRKYDLTAKVPKINGGSTHYVNQAIEYATKIWTDMGFKEISGSMTETSFWNFDVLFTPQDHPAREMQDTFFIKNVLGKLPEKSLVDSIKKVHEKGIDGSNGWGYKWAEEEAKKVLLRTHTTCLSARALTQLKKENFPAKLFAIGKAFRNETLDWSHLFEFYQTEGIVVDKNVNLTQLLGYLKEFYKKMGFEKIRFRPSYFPYTEPSVEIEIFHPERQKWLELGGAGIFRPEVTEPLIGKEYKVLAWGQGFERIILDYYKIKDLRNMYSNDIQNLRDTKTWMKT
ncbi:phenylalanine--tRNA ligase subunit alpha [Candidatus Pacearchaeota archaeon]|nr:phenylalanine--tRNA ligase subunit alpha [Candidatus Pacearchaeota archaeon]